MRRLLALGIVLVFAAVAALGCSSGGGQTVKIGFFAPLTGPAAADGASCLNAAQLAVEKINAAGGIKGKKVELVYYDDALDPKQAISIAEKLTTKDKVVAVVSGSYSGTTRAAAPVYQKAKIPMISAYAVHPDITRTGDYIFRQSFVGTVQGRAGAYVAVKLLGAKRISILHIDNDFGKTLAESFKEMAEKLGAQVVSVDSFAAGEKEFVPLLTKIKGLKPDVLYAVGYVAEGPYLVRQAKDMQLGIQIIGTEGFDSTKQFLGVAGDAAEGIIITTNLNRDSERNVTREFIEDYTKKYGYAPDMVGASTYDAFLVLAHVMNENGTSPEKIKEGMYKVRDFPAVTGVIKGYNSLGEVTKAVQVQIVKNGAFHYFAEISDPEVITPPEK